MSLTILDPYRLTALLTGMWQKRLGTDEDPANGKWFTNGANGNSVGLYGGLTDSMASNAVLDVRNQQYRSRQIVAAASVVDNRNGQAPKSSPTLTYTYEDEVSMDLSKSDAVLRGAPVSFTAKTELCGDGGDASTKMSIDYSYSSTDESSRTQKRSQSVTQQVEVVVPDGKVYKAVLLASEQWFEVPCALNVYVTGTTETWFEDRVNDHFNWTMDIGSAFALAGDPLYRQDPQTGKGFSPAVGGILKGQQTTDFVVQIWDVTGPVDAPVPERGAVVSTTPLGVEALKKAG